MDVVAGQAFSSTNVACHHVHVEHVLSMPHKPNISCTTPKPSGTRHSRCITRQILPSVGSFRCLPQYKNQKKTKRRSKLKNRRTPTLHITLPFIDKIRTEKPLSKPHTRLLQQLYEVFLWRNELHNNCKACFVINLAMRADVDLFFRPKIPNSTNNTFRTYQTVVSRNDGYSDFSCPLPLSCPSISFLA